MSQTQTTPLSDQKVCKIKLLENWLLSGRTITARKASQMWGYDRAADGIYKLRKRHMRIATTTMSGKDRFLNDVEYGVYKWLGEIPVITYKGTNGKAEVYTFRHQYPMKTHAIKTHAKDYLRLKKVTIKKMRLAKGILTINTNAGKKIFIIEKMINGKKD